MLVSVPPVGVRVHTYRSILWISSPVFSINSSYTYFKTLSELNSILPEYVPSGAEKEPVKL